MTPHREFTERRSTPVYTMSRSGFLAAVAFVDGSWCWTVWDDGGECLAGRLAGAGASSAAAACTDAHDALNRRAAEKAAARAFKVPEDGGDF